MGLRIRVVEGDGAASGIERGAECLVAAFGGVEAEIPAVRICDPGIGPSVVRIERVAA